MGFNNILSGQPNTWLDSSLRHDPSVCDKKRPLWHLCGVLKRAENVRCIAGLLETPQVHQATSQPCDIIPGVQYRNFQSQTVYFVSVDGDTHEKIMNWALKKGYEPETTSFDVEVGGVRRALWEARKWDATVQRAISDQSLDALIVELRQEAAARGRASGWTG